MCGAAAAHRGPFSTSHHLSTIKEEHWELPLHYSSVEFPSQSYEKFQDSTFFRGKCQKSEKLHSGLTDSWINNTAVGADAVLNNTLGNQNTAVGSAAIVGNGEGNSNTAVGYNALFHNGTGDNNTADGIEALFTIPRAATTLPTAAWRSSITRDACTPQTHP